MSHSPAPDHDPGAAAEDWWVFRGPADLPAPPPWRSLAESPKTPTAHQYLMGPEHVAVVNAALHLRRPLLVTGRPGTGKSSLAHAIAEDLELGDVLRWPVNSRSTLTDALYRYDAVGRLREATLERETRATRGVSRKLRQRPRGRRSGIGDFLRLGPLGTALAATDRPRVLLIDELDKADIDLPNDLLVVLEEGAFEIPELARLPEDQQSADVLVTGSRKRVKVHRGTVSCSHFPIVVMTSNGERDFPRPFSVAVCASICRTQTRRSSATSSASISEPRRLPTPRISSRTSCRERLCRPLPPISSWPRFICALQEPI